MLKEEIYVWVDGLGEREFKSVHDLVKEYFRLYIEEGINNFTEINYRGYDIVINDDGYTDAMDIQANLISQIKEINKDEDNREM